MLHDLLFVLRPSKWIVSTKYPRQLMSSIEFHLWDLDFCQCACSSARSQILDYIFWRLMLCEEQKEKKTQNNQQNLGGHWILRCCFLVFVSSSLSAVFECLGTGDGHMILCCQGFQEAMICMISIFNVGDMPVCCHVGICWLLLLSKGNAVY